MAQEESRRGRLLPVLAWTAGVGALLALIAFGASSCGPSPLSKAYEAYDAKVEKLLDPDAALVKKLGKLYNEQTQSSASTQTKFEDCVTKEAVPYYDDLVAKLSALDPGDKELVAAHELVVKYAKSMDAYAHHLASNLEIFRPDPAAEAMAEKQGAAQNAELEYDKWVHGEPTRVADSRFTELHGISNDFNERVEGFAKYRVSREDLESFLRKDALPRVKKLRAGRFDEDAQSKLLREAIATAEEFYSTFADQLPSLDRNRRFAGEAERLLREGEDLREKFRTELQTVRRKR